jgi:hypothetical protein
VSDDTDSAGDAKDKSAGDSKDKSVSPASSAPPATTQAVVDDARHAADGLRSTARWIGVALASIPGLALAGTLLKPPNGSEFNPWLLTVGVALAAGGAFCGILALATVSKPVAIQDSDLSSFRMGRVVEAIDGSYAMLLERIRRTYGAATDAASRAVRLQLRADIATAALASATALAEKLQALAKDSNSRTAHKDADDARNALAAASVAAGQASGHAAAARTASDQAQRQLTAALSIRKAVFSLKATDEISRRYSSALRKVAASSAAVAAGIALIVLAPTTKTDDETADLTDLSVITFTLTDSGKSKICKTDRPITALKLSTDSKNPTVITLPTPGCPSKKTTIRFGEEPPDATLIPTAD